jgi:hypothetical protein
MRALRAVARLVRALVSWVVTWLVVRLPGWVDDVVADDEHVSSEVLKRYR